MSDVRGGEIVGLELGLEDRDRGINEEAWVGGARAGPDYVGRGVVVPGCGLGEDAIRFRGGGEVCGDGLEALRFVDSTGLLELRSIESLHGWSLSVPWYVLVLLQVVGGFGLRSRCLRLSGRGGGQRFGPSPEMHR